MSEKTLVNELDKLVEDNNIYNKEQSKTQKELNEENKVLRQCIENELEDVTVEGTEITVNDAANYYGKMVIRGNTEQASYTGYNLADVSPYIAETKNGVTLTKDEQGNLVFNGTATTSFGWNITYTQAKTLRAGNYTKSVQKDTVISNYVTVSLGYNNASISGTSVQPGAGVGTFNLAQDIQYDQFRIYISNNTVFNNYKLNYMLLEGTYTAETIPGYEPYVRTDSLVPHQIFHKIFM